MKTKRSGVSVKANASVSGHDAEAKTSFGGVSVKANASVSGHDAEAKIVSSDIAVRGSFKRQIVLIFVVGFFILIAAFVTYMVKTESTYLYRDSTNETNNLAESLAASSAPWVLANDVAGLQEIVNSFQTHPELRYAMVISRSGRVLAHSDATKVGRFVSDERSLALIKEPPKSRVLIDDESTIDIAVPIVIDHRHVAWARIAQGRENIAGNLHQMIWSSALFVLLAAILSLLAAIAIANRLGYRIGTLLKVAEEVQAGNFDTRANISGADEVSILGNSLNQMLDMLAQDKEALRVSEQHLRFALEGSGDGVWEWNLQTSEIILSDAGLAMLGLARNETGNDMSEWAARIHPEDTARWRSDTLAYIKGSSPNFSSEYRMRCKDGSWKWLLTRGMAVSHSADGRVLQMFGTQADITERKQVEEKLQLGVSVFTHAREGIVITDADGTIVDVNDTFTEITGYSRKEVLGQNPRLFQSGQQSPEFYAAMWKSLIEKGYWYGEIWNHRKNGEAYAEMINIGTVRDASGNTKNYVALFTDITLMKEHEQQLENIAHYDALTGLPNRVMLADRLQQAMILSQRRGQLLAVVYLDLDGFKTVNDKYGHDVGDELLIAIAQRMKVALREGDSLARIGGDEFVAVLVDLERAQDCDPVLARLLKAASDPVAVAEVVLQVSASIGVTLYPQDAADADQLMRHADQAMYAAKQAGKNRYHLFDVVQDAAVQIQRESLEHIRLALDRREFVLYYQPKVNMKTRELIGVEALVRWQHPERGLLPPSTFLPIIELLPISVELGEWVIDAALTQISEWNAQGLDVPVSVNVGARQLQEGNFVIHLSELLATHPDVKSSQLELEILETSALEDIAKITEIMHACREIGVCFALDDFGTGYSSLTYLKHLPAELIKIDQSFVRDMLSDPNDLAIVQGVIGLAKAFHRQVIAEGVETEAHGTLLLSMGCELAQGYGIARPMPASELPSWAANWCRARTFVGENI